MTFIRRDKRINNEESLEAKIFENMDNE